MSLSQISTDLFLVCFASVLCRISRSGLLDALREIPHPIFGCSMLRFRPLLHSASYHLSSSWSANDHVTKIAFASCSHDPTPTASSTP